MPSICADRNFKEITNTAVHKSVKNFPNDISKKIATEFQTLVAKLYNDLAPTILLSGGAYKGINNGTVIACTHLEETQK